MERSEVLGLDAVGALMIQGEQLELFGVLHPRSTRRESGIDLWMIGVDGPVASHEAQSDHARFEGPHTVNPPAVGGNADGEVKLDCAFGGKAFDHAVAVFVM